LAASVLEAAQRVLGFSVRSKNLKGTHIKILRDASAAIAVDATLMANRMATGSSGENLVIMEVMTIKNQQLKASQEEQRKEMEELR
ncbi:hypothetical protein EAI_15649, partial [Harpegnathos saltator]